MDCSNGEVLFWVGCMSSYRVPELAKSMMSVADKLSIPLKLLGVEEGCCGSILLRLGDRRGALQVARVTANVIESSNAKILVTHCPGCLRTFKLDYPQLGLSLTVDVKHSTQLLADYVGRAELKPINMRVAYLDPCHLGRHVGVYDEPRLLLRSIPGLEVVEPPESRESSLCCGAGGGVRACYEELAMAVARELLAYFKFLGAEACVTACPFCYYNLKASSEGLLEVYDVLQLLDMSIRGVKS